MKTSFLVFRATFVLGLFVLPTISLSENVISKIESDKSKLIKDVREVRKQLRQSSSMSIPIPESEMAKESLSELINNLNSLDVPEVEKHSSKNKSEAIQDTETKTSIPEPKEIDTDKSVSKIQHQDSGILKMLTEESDKIINPFDAAESMFAAKHFQHAAKLYEIALKRIKDEKDPNRSWIIFQTANCVRNSDPKKASELYEQLITLFPDSRWVSAAKSQNAIIKWQQNSNMKVMLEKFVSDPNSL